MSMKTITFKELVMCTLLAAWLMLMAGGLFAGAVLIGALMVIVSHIKCKSK